MTCMSMNAEAKRFLRLRYYPDWVSEHLFLFPLIPRPSPFLGWTQFLSESFFGSLCRWGLGFLRILLERLFCVVPATLLQRVGGSKAIDSEAPNQTSDILEHLGHSTAEALPTGCIFYIQWNPGSTRGVFLLTLVLDSLWLAKVVANIRAEVMGRRCVGNPSIFWSVILARLSCHWLYWILLELQLCMSAPVHCETQKRDSGFKLLFCSCVACAIICASFFSRRCCLVVPVVCLCCDCTESLPCATNYEWCDLGKKSKSWMVLPCDAFHCFLLSESLTMQLPRRFSPGSSHVDLCVRPAAQNASTLGHCNQELRTPFSFHGLISC